MCVHPVDATDIFEQVNTFRDFAQFFNIKIMNTSKN